MNLPGRKGNMQSSVSVTACTACNVREPTKQAVQVCKDFNIDKLEMFKK